MTFIGNNHLAVKLPQDSGGGVVSVTTRAGTSAANIDATSSLCSGLSTNFGNTGITDDNTSPGNVDGFGYSFSAQALAAQGFVPGAVIQSHGVSFTWPAASTGSPDNALAAGQTFGLIGSPTTLGFLAASTYPTTGSGTINYTDRSTQSYTLNLPNWADAPPSTVDIAATLPYRNGPGGRDNRNVYVFYAGVQLDPAKTVKSVQLPLVGAEVGANVPAMHIFAAGLAGNPDLALRKPATQSSEAFGGSASRAVDGDTNGVFYNNSVSHTDLNARTWWQTDLGTSSPISSINVWNRTDCCSNRLDNSWVFVSNTPFDTSLIPRNSRRPVPASGRATSPGPRAPSPPSAPASRVGT